MTYYTEDEDKNYEIEELANALDALVANCKDVNNAILFFKVSMLLRAQQTEIYQHRERMYELLFVLSSRNKSNQDKLKK